MKRIIRYFRCGWVAWAVLLLLFSACSKLDVEYGPISYADPGEGGYYNSGPNSNDLGIGTIRTYGLQRYVRLDDSTIGMIVNPKAVEDIPDGTRVFIQYRCVVLGSNLPEFFTDAVLVEWARPLEVGEVYHEAQSRQGDPISVIMDWMTTLEDGYLTIHYSIPSSGNASHKFSLCPGEKEHEYILIRDANGDTKGDWTDGIVCFYVSSMLPDTGGETVTLSLTYLELDNTSKTLTVDYRSPQ